MNISTVELELPTAEYVKISNDALFVELRDGSTVSAPLAWFPRLLHALVRSGLVFDKIIGFSAGALTGARYGFGWPSDVLEKWRNIERARVYRFAPRGAAGWGGPMAPRIAAIGRFSWTP